MAYRNNSVAYGSVTKFLHWLIFFLLFFMLVFGYFLEEVPAAYRPITYNLHKLTGLLILSLMVLRLCWTLFNTKPLLPVGTPNWQRHAERGVHFLIYIAVIGMPLSGWIGSIAGGRPPHIGDFLFNLPIESSKVLAGNAFEIHGILAIAIIVLVSLHILAALYHYLIKKDNVLQRMLPGSSRF